MSLNQRCDDSQSATLAAAMRKSSMGDLFFVWSCSCMPRTTLVPAMRQTTLFNWISFSSHSASSFSINQQLLRCDQSHLRRGRHFIQAPIRAAYLWPKVLRRIVWFHMGGDVHAYDLCKINLGQCEQVSRHQPHNLDFLLPLQQPMRLLHNRSRGWTGDHPLVER